MRTLTDDLGGELGTIMRVKKGKKYYLKGAVFNIAKCQCATAFSSA
ncbi:MAG: hypothetical protein R2794_01970 [Chitinophagales bacterium]